MGKKILDHSISAGKEALAQFKSCYNEKYVVSAALMPDAHLGYAAPIGAVIATKDYVVPAWVGFDIGCGVAAMQLKGKGLMEKIMKNRKKIHTAVSKSIPLGKGQKNSKGMLSPETERKFTSLLADFQKKEHDKQILNLIKTMGQTQLGTLGGGNHFLEIDHAGNEIWLVIHSGSRGLGHKIAAHYMRIASALSPFSEGTNIEQTFPLSMHTKQGMEYMNAHDFCLQFALLSREEMARRVIAAIEKITKVKIKASMWINKNHNHVVFERKLLVHRKGATPAHKGERGVIPANMRDGSFLVIGKGSSKFLNSSSHGAGRVMSRSSARNQFTAEDLAQSMKGIEADVSEQLVDEIPMAYKDITAVMAKQKSSVRAVKHLLPLINWKGTETSYLD